MASTSARQLAALTGRLADLFLSNYTLPGLQGAYAVAWVRARASRRFSAWLQDTVFTMSIYFTNTPTRA